MKKGGDPREEEGIAATDDGAGRRSAPVVRTGLLGPRSGGGALREEEESAADVKGPGRRRGPVARVRALRP
jgi:hypothetical protein